MMIIQATLQQAAGESNVVTHVDFFIHLQGLGSSQLAKHLVNEINLDPLKFFEPIVHLNVLTFSVGARAVIFQSTFKESVCSVHFCKDATKFFLSK